MPTYSYKCKNCGHSFDVQQSITDAALTKCPNCDGELQKVFGVGSVTFKGSGFYKTDSKTSGGSDS
ncbi:MAG: FmdB family zinc ribbon protein [Micrococcales bacterium]